GLLARMRRSMSASRPPRRPPADAVPPPATAGSPSGTDRMDIKLIRRLVRLMTGGKISELEIDDTQNGLRVRLKSAAAEGSGQGSPVVYHMQGHMPAVMPGAGGGMASPGGAQGAGGAQDAGAGAAAASNLHPITSPLVGTFYRSPSPD